MARQALNAARVVAPLLVIGAALSGCSSESSQTRAAASSSTSSSAPSASGPRVGGPVHLQRPRSGSARVDASALPVPEDFEGEFRKQITSSNYLDALGSAAAEASAAKRTHP